MLKLICIIYLKYSKGEKTHEFFKQTLSEAKRFDRYRNHFPTNIVQVNSRATYYANMLLDANLKPLTKKGDFQKILSEIPTDKVVVFFNAQLFEYAREPDFMALDEYINLAKEKKAEEAFYRGLRHGPAVLSAFSKDLVPENFDGGFFFGCIALAMYL